MLEGCRLLYIRHWVGGRGCPGLQIEVARPWKAGSQEEPTGRQGHLRTLEPREIQSAQVQVLKETAGDDFRCVAGAAGGWVGGLHTGSHTEAGALCSYRITDTFTYMERR